MSWMSSQPEPSDPVVIGRVLRPHGLVGEVIVDPTDSRTVHFEPGTCLWMAGSWREVIRCRAQGDRWIVRLGGVADRDEAGTLRDEEISVNRRFVRTSLIFYGSPRAKMKFVPIGTILIL